MHKTEIQRIGTKNRMDLWHPSTNNDVKYAKRSSRTIIVQHTVVILINICEYVYRIFSWERETHVFHLVVFSYRFGCVYYTVNTTMSIAFYCLQNVHSNFVALAAISKNPIQLLMVEKKSRDDSIKKERIYYYAAYTLTTVVAP